MEREESLWTEGDLFEDIPCGILRFAAEEEPDLLRANGACAGLFGYDSREALLLAAAGGRGLVAEEDWPEVRAAALACARGQDCPALRFRIRTARGEHLWVEGRLRPVLDRGRHALQMILAPVEAPAPEEDGREKRQFLSRMSHDIRTPLSAILALSRLAQQETDEAGVRACIDSIVESGRQLLETMDDVLAPLGVPAGETKETPLPGRELEGMRLLLVEDHPVNRSIARRLMESHGCRVEEAENGKTALEALESAAPGTYQAVLMDVRMPVMNGLEAARRIREHRRADLRALPVVATTANAFAEDEALCRAAGMDAYLTKPVDMERLVAVLRRHRRKAAEEL